MPVPEWREAYDGLGGLLPAAEGVAVELVDADGVPAEWIGTGEGPVVVYVHGGGYCIGSLDSHRSVLTHLASAVAGRRSEEHTSELQSLMRNSYAGFCLK